MVTVAMQHNALSSKRRRAVFRRAPDKKFAQQERLFAQPFCAFALRKEIQQLIAHDAGAARLKKDEGHSRVNLRSKDMKDLFQISTGLLQKTEIVEGAPAADMLLWREGGKPRIGQHPMRGSKHLRMKVVVPRVRPQHHLGLRVAAFRAALITAWSKLRKPALRRDPQNALGKRADPGDLQGQVGQARRNAR